MEAINCILGRRSIRRYKAETVPEDDLNKVLEAFRWAPSWANSQCWELVVVRDRLVREKLQGTLPRGNPARAAITEAPVLVAACGRAGKSGFYKGSVATAYGDWMMFDLGIATQNLCLAAHSLGLGTVHVGLLDHVEAGKILGLPEDVKVVELIPLGYPDHEPVRPPRKDLKEFVSQDCFGRK